MRGSDLGKLADYRTLDLTFLMSHSLYLAELVDSQFVEFWEVIYAQGPAHLQVVYPLAHDQVCFIGNR